MHVILTVSTDANELALKRSFTVSKEQRTKYIHAIATLLNVSMRLWKRLNNVNKTNALARLVYILMKNVIGAK